MSENTDKSTGVIDVKVYESAIKEKGALLEVIANQDTLLESYKALGDPTVISEALDKAKSIVENLQGVDITTVKPMQEELDSYRQIGKAEDINKAVDESLSIIEAYMSLGSPVEISSAIDKSTEIIESYKELGTPSEISEAFDAATKLLSQYEALGTVEEITKAIDILESQLNTSKFESIASKYNKDADLIRRMYDKVGNFQVVEELLEEGFNPTGKRVVVTGEGKTHINESSQMKRVLSQIS